VAGDVKSEEKKLYVKKMRSCMNQGFYFPSGATKLFDFLYLAGEDEATNVHLLSELGITHVINCAAGYNLIFCVCFALVRPRGNDFMLYASICLHLYHMITRDAFEDNTFEAKTSASAFQGQGHLKSIFEWVIQVKTWVAILWDRGTADVTISTSVSYNQVVTFAGNGFSR